MSIPVTAQVVDIPEITYTPDIMILYDEVKNIEVSPRIIMDKLSEDEKSQSLEDYTIYYTVTSSSSDDVAEVTDVPVEYTDTP